MDDIQSFSFMDFDLMELAYKGCFPTLNLALENIELYNFDVNSIDERRNTMLHYAAEKGDIVIVNKLIELGSYLNSRNSKGDTPLHLACKQQNSRIIEVLLENKADVNIRNRTGETPIFSAISVKSQSIVMCLLSAGAQLNVRNKILESPLHAAVKVNDVELSKFFIQNGISSTAETLCGETPLQIAITAGSEDVIKYFRQLENDFTIKDYKERSLLHLAVQQNLLNTCKWFLSIDSIDVNHQDFSGSTALHYAAELNCTELIELLLNNNAKIDQLDENNNTPLHRAARMKYNGDAVEILLKYNARRDIKTFHGDLPLHIAAARGNEKAVMLLYQEDHSTLFNKYNMTPEALAIETGRLNILYLFKNLDNDLLNHRESTNNAKLLKRRRVSFSGIPIIRRKN